MPKQGPGKLTRRAVLVGAGAATLAGAAATVATFRFHRRPRQNRFLETAHLDDLRATMASAPGRRVLFIGNSGTLRGDIPSRVAALAAADGVELTPATAAADGARWIETLRIDALRRLLAEVEWDALVLQDFTKTPLRIWDRWGSAWAAGRMAELAGRPPVLLFPPWPGAPGHPVYRSGGFMEAVPDGPADYARRTMDFYQGVAASEGFHVAPVPTRWLETGPDPGLYARDGHHASQAGAGFVARILWQSLRLLIA